MAAINHDYDNGVNAAATDDDDAVTHFRVFLFYVGGRVRISLEFVVCEPSKLESNQLWRTDTHTVATNGKRPKIVRLPFWAVFIVKVHREHRWFMQLRLLPMQTACIFRGYACSYRRSRHGSSFLHNSKTVHSVEVMLCVEMSRVTIIVNLAWTICSFV